MVLIPISITRCDGRNRRVERDADPCLPFKVHLYMGLHIYYKGNLKTGTEVLSIVLHTSSSNTRSCFVGRLKDKTLLLPYLYGEERPNELRGALQVENRFPSVKMFITNHQPKSFPSP